MMARHGIGHASRVFLTALLVAAAFTALAEPQPQRLSSGEGAWLTVVSADPDSGQIITREGEVLLFEEQSVLVVAGGDVDGTEALALLRSGMPIRVLEARFNNGMRVVRRLEVATQ